MHPAQGQLLSVLADLDNHLQVVIQTSVFKHQAQEWLTRIRSVLHGERALRVLIVLSQQPGGTGSGIYVNEMIRELLKQGHDLAGVVAHYRALSGTELSGLPDNRVYTLTFTEHANQQPHGEVSFPLPGMSIHMPYTSKPFRELSVDQLEEYVTAFYQIISRAIDEFQPDLLHVNHLWFMGPIARLVAGWLPIIATVHGTAFKLLRDKPDLGQWVLPGIRTLDRVLPISFETANQAVDAFGVSPDRIRIIGNGYSHELFYLRSVDRLGLLARYGLAKAAEFDQIILFVGKFADFKGIPYLIRALPYIHTNYSGSCALLIIGDGPAHMRALLQAEIERLCLTSCVFLVGKVPHAEVATFMNVANLFVLPSLDEPFGLVLIEALACGLRSVATARGGPPSFVPRELQMRGLAELVEPIQVDARLKPLPIDEEPFVIRLSNAIIRGLAAPTTLEDRVFIAQSVHNQTWVEKAREVAEVYQEVLSSKASEVERST